MNKYAAVTIISLNYMPFARILNKSITETNQDIDFYVFVIDFPSSYIDSSGLKIIGSRDVKIDSFAQRAMYYDITEFNTSVKPDLLIHLIKKGYESVIYLDPDIKVYGELTKVFRILETSDFFVTPHITSPINDDKFPTEVDMLKTGVYNLGFIGASAGAQRTLEWWSERLKDLCFNDPGNGLFTDQKWVDLLPAMSKNVHIEYSPAFNVAYWNLHERKMDFRNGKHYVNGEELVFFHFSGIDVENPENVSRYQNRSNFRVRPDLIKIFSDYVNEVKLATSTSDKSYIYKYSRLFETYQVTDMTRRLYKRFIDLNAHKSNVDPFKDSSSDSFVAWLIKNGLAVTQTSTHEWEKQKILYKAEDLLRNKYSWQFKVLSYVLRIMRRRLGDKRYSDLMRVMSILSNSRRGVVVYDEKIKER